MRDVLETERLTLRRFGEADLEDLVALHNDPEVMRFLNGGSFTPRAEIARDLRERFAGPGYWAAVETATGAFLGWFALHPVDGRDPDDLELGYRLRKAAWGHGFATEGTWMLIDAAFREMGARRVWAQTMAVNRASRRVMEKAGLRFVRVFHPDWEEPLPGADQGEVEYALTRADWERRGGRQPDPPGAEGERRARGSGVTDEANARKEATG